MIEVNLEKLNGLMMRCLKLVSASRRLFKDCGVEMPNLVLLERELRESLKEIQEKMTEVGADADRPLIDR